MIKAIVVDDEPLARQSLILTLQDLGGVQVIGECENGFEAVKSIRKLKPDLVFLDIQMPKLSGFDVIELMENDMPPVIFVTAYDEYALKAFEANAVDYLMKPVNPARLKSAMQKIPQAGPANNLAVQEMMERRSAESIMLQRLLIREGSEVYILEYQEIEFVQAQGDYMLIHANGKDYLKGDTMDQLQKRLPAEQFKRVHRSYLINIDCLKKIEPYSRDDKMAILKSGKEIPISRSGYQELKKIL
jgi:two-component system LytT family response regulator